MKQPKKRHEGAGERSVSGERWTVDRRLPLAMLSAIGIQSAAAVWWAANVSARIDAIEKRQESTSSQGERLVRVEEAVKSLESSLQEKSNQLRENFAQGMADIKQLVLTLVPPRPDSRRSRSSD